ncbi:MarR family winged helix-turn-helix transcriptional regulator [Peribacillus sp. B-H-3]|uniref:MarR family winged helix-turn-helix transcriptional regulator n=1 Tax=Peribacillus sp. B-H-3 TaxID=3400420 RepID=UPI003B0138B0
MFKDEIGFTASSTSKKIRGLVSKVLKGYNITAEQWTVLKELTFVSSLSQKELSAKTDKDQATLTKILDLLEKHDLATRIPNPEDRRSFLVEVSEKGRSTVEAAMPAVEDMYGEILQGITDEHLHLFMNILVTIQRNISKHEASNCLTVSKKEG